VGLPYQIVEGLGPIFSGEDLVAHALNLNALIDASKHKSVNQERKTKQDFELLIGRWTLSVGRSLHVHKVKTRLALPLLSDAPARGRFFSA
jgi:hypothetical protein